MFCVCKHTGKVLCIFNKDWWEFPQSLRFLQIYLLYIFFWKTFPSLNCWLIWYARYERQLCLALSYVLRDQMVDANIHVTVIILHTCKSANICSTISPHRSANPHNRAELNDSSATSTGFWILQKRNYSLMVLLFSVPFCNPVHNVISNCANVPADFLSAVEGEIDCWFLLWQNEANFN